jgi:hypothetical protein
VTSEIIKSNKFRKVAANIKPDLKKRVVLSKIQLPDDVTYHIYCNDVGQIILDPQISIPASEAWLFNNPEYLKVIEKGLKQAARGKITEVDMEKL